MIAIISIFGCTDIFETDIDDEIVYLNSPYDGLRTDITNHLFWWEHVGGADGYNLQIVSPSFEKTVRKVLDTNITSNEFSYILYPGEFEWRVGAYNSSYGTLYSYASFTIIKNDSITNDIISLKTPTNNQAFSLTKLKFEWLPLEKATDYRFRIEKDTWTGQNAIIDTILTDNSFEVNISEGTFIYGVQGINSPTSTYTSFSMFTFIVDTTPPKKPTLKTPNNSQEINELPIDLTWTNYPDNGSSINDSIIISSDSLFKSIMVRERMSKKSYSLNDIDEGTFYWKVKSVDDAGNSSSFTTQRAFIYKNK